MSEDDDIDDEVRRPRRHDDESDDEQDVAPDEEEEQEEFDPDNFTLTEEGEKAVSAARNIARHLLSHPSITPKDVVALGKALYALERMPLSTPGIDCSFGVTLRCGDEDYSETECMSFEITSSTFEITRGGSTSQSSVGSDSILRPGCLIEVGGYCCCECDVSELEDAVSNYMASRCEIEIYDGSDQDFTMDEEE